MNTHSSIWLCLHFSQLPIEVFDRHQQEKPVVITSRQRVVYMNRSAQKLGIKPGSSMNTAYTISEQVVSFERDEEKELATLSQLAQWAYQFSPNVSIKVPHSILLDITGCLKLFRGIKNLKAAISEGLNRLGFTAATGINGTPMSALCFAESGLAESSLAESGAEKASIEIIPSDRVADSLHPIPIQFLRIDEHIQNTLHQMGISRCQQLFELPIDGLNRRFGIFFTDYLQRLTGEKPDPQKFVADKPRFRSDVTFLSDVTNTQSLVFPMKRLLGELQDFLIGRQLLVNQFSFKLSHRNHSPKELSIILANPDRDAQMFLMLSQLQLDKVRDMPEIDNVSLAAGTFFEAEADSGDLFHGTQFKQKDGRTHSKAEEARAVRLINMMTARLGPQACFGLSLANDHRPEFAWKPVTMAAKDYWHDDQLQGNVRPLYLLPTPKILSSDAPYLSGKLELLQGPERIDFGWWDNKGIARDYYIAQHPSGALYWIYQHLHDRSWHLHGIFS